MCPELDEKAYVPIDLSVDSRDLKTYHLHSSLTFSDFIKNHLESHQKKIAFGGYLEKRQLYKTVKRVDFSKHSEFALESRSKIAGISRPIVIDWCSFSCSQ